MPSHCDSGGQIALGIVEIRTGIPGGIYGGANNPDGVFYVEDRNFLLGNGVWVWEESNGKPGLQRGGQPPFTPDNYTPCVDDHDVPPDTLIL